MKHFIQEYPQPKLRDERKFSEYLVKYVVEKGIFLEDSSQKNNSPSGLKLKNCSLMLNTVHSENVFVTCREINQSK